MDCCATYSKEVMPLINSILTNTVALSIRNNLNSSNSKMSCTLERLSSGLKINRVKDDTANSIIATKTDIQLSGLNIASKNAQHGTSMLNVADSALENMTDKVIRIRDLILKAKNSTCSNEEKQALQDEINELTKEIFREKDNTTFNERKIFDPSINEVEEIKPPEKPYKYEVEYLSFPTGSNAKQYCIELGSFADYDAIDYTFTSTNKSNKDVLLGKEYGTGFIAFDTADKLTMGYSPTPAVSSFSVSENITPAQKGDGTKRTLHFEYDFSKYPKSVMAFGAYGTATFSQSKQIHQITCYKDGEMVRDFIPVIDNNNVACLYDKVTETFFYNKGSSDFITGDIIPPDESIFITNAIDNSVNLQIGENDGVDNMVNVDLGFNLDAFEIDVSTLNSCKVGVQLCDELIDVFSMRRSQVGSCLNRIESIMTLQDNNIINLNSKKSLIKDADIAEESTNLTQTQILQQITSSLFTQANQINGNLALRLLGVG